MDPKFAYFGYYYYSFPQSHGKNHSRYLSLAFSTLIRLSFELTTSASFIHQHHCVDSPIGQIGALVRICAGFPDSKSSEDFIMQVG